MSSEQYCNELSGVVALPDRCKCSLMEYANRIRLAILSEQSKINPDNSLISLLCDAARIGYEYGECAQGNLELAQQQLTCNNTSAEEPPAPQGKITPCEYTGKCLDYENGSCNGNSGNCGKAA